MRNRTKINWLISLSLLLGACQDERELVPTSDKISFSTITYNTKASSFTPDNAGSPNPILSMGVFAAATGSDNYDANVHSVNYLNHIEVRRANISSEWTYANPSYWPEGFVTFFGYAPYGKATPDVSGTGAPILSFKVDADPINQVDLLIATPAADRTKTTSAVTMAMRHALTKIGFSARLSHEPTEAEAIESIQISDIELLGIYGSGKRGMDISSDWNSLGDLKSGNSNNLYAVAVNRGLKDVELTSAYQNITAPDGFFLMIPQSLSGEREGVKALVRVHVSAKWTNPDTPDKDIFFVDPVDFELELTGLDWKQGDAINYRLYIDITEHTVKNSKIEAKLVDWDEIEIETDQLSRELKVSRIEADVNGSAVTRIHFWSNQPYVWIDAEGKISDAGGFPTGNTFAVNNTFTKLGLVLNPGDDFNIRYDQYNKVSNFNYDASSGTGYFDVENTTISASANNTFHVFLCATNSKNIDKPLRRSVRLNKIVDNTAADKNITTRYVGVFHRGHETGERIITWNETNDADWTAVIENGNSGGEWGNNLFDDYNHVLIDRFISPAQEQGILYTDNPGNPEDFQVYPWEDAFGGRTADGKRWISGTSKVYLRIGWDSKAPGAPFNNPPGSVDIVRGTSYRNRYATVTIRKGKNNPAGEIMQTLYLRQGELSDYLMRPVGDSYYPDANDGRNWSISSTGSFTYMGGIGETNDRPYAQRISPYNLSDPLKGSGGTVATSHNLLTPKGGVFADYPSQAGYMLRFNDELRAYNPANPARGVNIQQFPGTFSGNDPWNPATDETCPPGYRRPAEKYGETSENFDFTQSEFTQTLFEQPAANKLNNEGGIIDNAGLINIKQGWYADGFFDRRKISGSSNDMTQVSSGSSVSYFGSLFYNKRTLASVFMTHAGDRLEGNGQLEWPGRSGLYWSDSQSTKLSYAWGLDFYTNPSNSRFAMTIQGYKGRAHAIRCVAETINSRKK